VGHEPLGVPVRQKEPTPNQHISAPPEDLVNRSLGAVGKKSVILMGYRHSLFSPRLEFPGAEMWCQSYSIRSWDWALYDWSRYFDVHTMGPQGQYSGIRITRPDVLDWYYRQGPERPIYFAEDVPNMRAAVRYPLEQMEAEFGKGHFGCQLDYMLALAISEKFERIIMSGNGAPYVDNPKSDQARKWYQRHSSAIGWLRLAQERGIEIEFHGPCMYRPFDGNYGFDMGPK
jgi:hypothetical protein